MTINGDVIYVGRRAFVNVGTKNTYISKMIANNAENIYSFNFYFGKMADKAIAQKYAGTYWIRVRELDMEVNEDATQELAIAR